MKNLLLYFIFSYSAICANATNKYDACIDIQPPPTYPNFSSTLSASNFTSTGNGYLTGSVTITNDVLVIAFTGEWSWPHQLNTSSPIISFGISPSLPNMELGPLLYSLATPSHTGYQVKIENNNLVLYSLSGTYTTLRCNFSFTVNLNDVDENGNIVAPVKWYADDDLDGLGDPLNFVEQVLQPSGNYVLDNSDLCPSVAGSNINCSNLTVLAGDKNYIKTISYKVPVDSELPNPQNTQVKTDIVYFDGLGRPIQQVAHKQSETGNDIVIPIVYDGFGRRINEYLPIPLSISAAGFTENEAVIADPTGYYNSLFDNDGSYRYSEKRLESSPLGRVLEQGAPGEDWAVDPESDGDHTIKFGYHANTALDAVKPLKAVATWVPSKGLYDIAFAPVPSPPVYDPYQLYKTITKDENWEPGSSNHTTEEFKNQQGQIVLKRTYNYGQKHDTYYVYDQFGNLTYVVPPLANGSIASAILEGLCYQYKYDSRNRLVEKKIPGKQQWEYIVYDKLDRVVATGPANSPFNNITAPGWLMTKYDAFNRPILTAWKQASVTTSSRKTLQELYNGATATAISEKRTTSPAANTTMNGVAFNYTNVAEPKTAYHVLTVNYYDDYAFTLATDWVPSTLATSSLGEPVHYNHTLRPKGLATGSWVRVLETSTAYKAERSYMLYDKKTRMVVNHKVNYMGGYIKLLTKYDFEGRVLQSETAHKRQASSQELVLNDYFTYTDQGRPLKHLHKINSGPEELIARNEYDVLGQLKNKRVGGLAVTPLGLQKIDYAYNIRGWLKAINDMESLAESGFPTDLFAFKIGYNEVEGTTVPLYNGNIGETYWKTHPENVLRKYSYEYDDLSRLTYAYYQKPELMYPNTDAYNEEISYDANGNILSLNRNGYQDNNDGNSYLIDKLVYKYENNQLRYVTDDSNSIDGFKDGENPDPGKSDYDYDIHGNMTMDWNKGIKHISYNHLNLPAKIEFATQDGNEKSISYLYNALGEKLRKIVDDHSVNPGVYIPTDYLDGFQYVDGNLQFFPTAEGYVNVTDGDKFNYVYNYTDHLGNIRLSYSQPKAGYPAEKLEENHYYPFGMKHLNYGTEKNDYKIDDEGGIFAVLKPVERNKYQYKYNGKEFQDELSLDWYDYGARNYDPAIGRWMNIDPLAEKYYGINPYAYAVDSPILFIDPDGRYVDTSYIYAKNKDGEYKNKALVEAFEVFAKSKEGIAFLGNFAEKGQVIAGHKYEKSGAFDKNDTDLNFGDDTNGADGRTTYKLKDNNLQITLNFDSTAVEPNIKTIAHEAFYHVEKKGYDFLDDRKLNQSNIDKDIVKQMDEAFKTPKYAGQKGWRTNYLTHMQGDRDEIDKKRTLPILKQYYKSKNIKKSDSEIVKSLGHM